MRSSVGFVTHWRCPSSLLGDSNPLTLIESDDAAALERFCQSPFNSYFSRGYSIKNSTKEREPLRF